MTDSNKTSQFDTSAEDNNYKKVEVSKNLEPFLNFSYFNEVNTFNECWVDMKILQIHITL